jgi:type IV pilus assembly protein PilY1
LGDTTQQQKVIAYLRGGNTFNAGVTTIEGIGQGQFRQRFGALGDISNAQPVIIGPPGRAYTNATDPAYEQFVSDPTRAGRPWVVVAPANDGMVHVFDAGPMPPAAGPGGGTEIFAYIPRALFRGVAGAAATEDVTGIQALTYQDGGVPIYHHHMYVDASPRAADVDFNNGLLTPPDGSSWHTIVVGGLGKGGNSFYALDLTDLTSVPNETVAANKVLWEWFNPDADVGPGQRIVTGGSPGYSYGHPVIVKVREPGYPTGRWVVIVTGGYNNLSGKGKVYFLDAATGQLLSTVTTPAGSTIATTGSNTNPQGLAQIHGFVRNENDQTIEQIYGGDLFGNAWRIDVSARSNPLAVPDYAANIYNGAGGLAPTTVLFAELKDPPPTSAVQPITTAPQIEIDLNNGIDRYVFFGTGRLLDPSDLTNPATPQPQTFYAIRDGTLQSVLTGGVLPIQPRLTMSPINPDGVSGIAGGAPNGWYQDLPSDPNDPILGAQRIVVDPVSQVNIASYIGTKIQDDPCVISLPAFLYARDYTSGASLLENSGGGIVPYLDFPGGGVGLQLVARTQLDGSISLGAMISGEIPGTTPVNIKNPVTGPGIRWSWRLLTGE